MAIFQAEVIADSVSPNGDRLTTLQLVYPRYIHSELLTHRQFSRSASSSRAIPVQRMISDIKKDPAIPVSFGRNQAGMQAGEELVGDDRIKAETLWQIASNVAITISNKMSELGVHKQVANRLLEPFQHMRTIVTATDWDNFFKLRIHPDADPNMQELAKCMKDAIDASEPYKRGTDYNDAMNWHLPYVTEREREEMYNNPLFLAAISSARCARVSYANHDGTEPNVTRDIELHNRLVASKHMSPNEHQAFPMNDGCRVKNFQGWVQYRCFTEMDLITPNDYVVLDKVYDIWLSEFSKNKLGLI